MSPAAHSLFLDSRVPLAIFASGGGSNAEAIIHYAFRSSTKYSVNLLVSNNSQCGAMQLATMFEIPTLHLSTRTHPDPKEYSRALCETLRAQNIGMIALAGYMKRLPEAVIAEYSHYPSARIFNIHPALLPKFGGEGMYGKRVHEAVLAAGEQESGCTVHEVEHEYDTGTIIAQKVVQVLPGDTPDTLAARVLEWEHQLYPETLHQKSLEITRRTL
ncbi:MAG: phosphoribosylglycinamide formyltransferase [Candidatus Kapaibacterium sp.]|nr:MAG: phosphoribosylglycinamide formyltransferase [Candidatus Kapabacteria bacterium]